VSKGRITESHAEATKSRISPVESPYDLIDVDFVIEAVSENVELKRKIFAELDAIVKEQTILATNTSSISITKIGAATKRPEKVKRQCGMQTCFVNCTYLCLFDYLILYRSLECTL